MSDPREDFKLLQARRAGKGPAKFRVALRLVPDMWWAVADPDDIDLYDYVWHLEGDRLVGESVSLRPDCSC